MASPQILEKLEDPNRNVRVRAVVAIAAAGGSQAVPLLIHTLKDSDGKVRAAAARALGKFEDPRAIEPLCHLLSDRDAEAAWMARCALLGFGVDILPSLQERLFDRNRNARHTAKSLVVALAPESIPWLCELLELDAEEAAETAAYLLAEISECCPALALRTAIPLLQRRLSPWWRRATSDEAPFREALAAIEAATAGISNRPIPVDGCTSIADRPIPAAAPERDVADLPLPHNEDSDAET